MRPQTIRFFKILASLVVAGLAIHTALLVLSGIALRNAYGELRAAGRPMSPKEIIPAPVPASENAAPLYESAFALLDSESVGDKHLLLFVADAARLYAGDPDSDDNRRAFEQALSHETFVRALDLVEQAAARPRCNFDLPYDQGAMLRVPHVHRLLDMGRILDAKALLHVRRGESARGWQTAEIILRMANALRDEPILIGAMARGALHQTALASMRNVAKRSPPDGETAARLLDLLAGADVVGPFILALDGERLLMGEWTYAQWKINGIISSDENGFWTARLMGLLGYQPSLQIDHASYLRTLGGIVDDVARPYWEIQPIPQPNREQEFPWYATVSRLILPNLAGPRIRMVHVQAMIRVARTSLALQLHKAAHGGYPASLAEIDPRFLDESPIDPFTGRPLVYRPENDGFVLYSFGENLQDDHGAEEPNDNWGSLNSDVVWRNSN